MALKIKKTSGISSFDIKLNFKMKLIRALNEMLGFIMEEEYWNWNIYFKIKIIWTSTWYRNNGILKFDAQMVF